MVVKQANWQVLASIWLLAGIMFVCSAAATMAAWWTWGPSDAPFEYVYHDQDAAEVVAGGIVLNRTLRVKRKVEITVTRELVRHEGQWVTKIALPGSRAIYEPGEYRLSRVLEIPEGVRPGVYHMMNVAHWKKNPLRDGALELPPIRVVIP